MNCDHSEITWNESRAVATCDTCGEELAHSLGYLMDNESTFTVIHTLEDGSLFMDHVKAISVRAVRENLALDPEDDYIVIRGSHFDARYDTGGEK